MVGSRRSTILSFMSSFQNDELKYLVDLVLKPFESLILRIRERSLDELLSNAKNRENLLPEPSKQVIYSYCIVYDNDL
jgi:hypothetical protein